jgi:hypothetical protein
MDGGKHGFGCPMQQQMQQVVLCLSWLKMSVMMVVMVAECITTLYLDTMAWDRDGGFAKLEITCFLLLRFVS